MKEGKIRGHRTHKAAFSIPLVESARRVLFGLCPHLSPVSRLLPCGFWKGIFRAHICGFPFAAMPRGGNFRPLRPVPRLCPVRTRSERPSRPDFSALYNVFLFPEKSFNLSALLRKWLKTTANVAEGFDSSTFQLVSSFQLYLSTFHPGCSILQIGCSILQIGCSILQIGCSILQIGCSILQMAVQSFKSADGRDVPPPVPAESIAAANETF